MPDTSTVVYWDSSAVLSALFKDANSRRAIAVAERDALHLLTTLAYAEVNAVISRMQREDLLTEALIQSAHEILARGPWRRISTPELAREGRTPDRKYSDIGPFGAYEPARPLEKSKRDAAR